jgi:hypothetical protein
MKTPRQHPNHTVYEWLNQYFEAKLTKNLMIYESKSLTILPTPIESAVLGSSHLRLNKCRGMPLLKPKTLLDILCTLKVISTQNVKEVIPWAGKTQVDNYTIGARVASNAIYDYLIKDQNSKTQLYIRETILDEIGELTAEAKTYH